MTNSIYQQLLDLPIPPDIRERCFEIVFDGYLDIDKRNDDAKNHPENLEDADIFTYAIDNDDIYYAICNCGEYFGEKHPRLLEQIMEVLTNNHHNFNSLMYDDFNDRESYYYYRRKEIDLEYDGKYYPMIGLVKLLIHEYITNPEMMGDEFAKGMEYTGIDYVKQFDEDNHKYIQDLEEHIKKYHQIVDIINKLPKLNISEYDKEKSFTPYHEELYEEIRRFVEKITTHIDDISSSLEVPSNEEVDRIIELINKFNSTPKI